MSNYIEYNDKVTFHPGYYIKEIVEDSGLTQEDFAKRLGTTPKNLCVLLKGEQNLSIEIAVKLSCMLGTTVNYWLNLQQAYDEALAQIKYDEELNREREVFNLIDYNYFCENFHLPRLPRRINEQIKSLREFLSIASLTVLSENNLMVRFRSSSEKMSQSNIVNANTMVQIAINQALKKELPRYNKAKFKKAVSFALTQTKNYDNFLPVIKKAFEEAGVVLVVLPNLKNSGINGASKKVAGKVMIMINDSRHYNDTFWFTLLHEIGHVLKGDLGISLEENEEDEADEFARNALIPHDKYTCFIHQSQSFDESDIRRFADSINQDPGIVLGRLLKDEIVPYSNIKLIKKLRHDFHAPIE